MKTVIITLALMTLIVVGIAQFGKYQIERSQEISLIDSAVTDVLRPYLSLGIAADVYEDNRRQILAWVPNVSDPLIRERYIYWMGYYQEERDRAKHKWIVPVPPVEAQRYKELRIK